LYFPKREVDLFDSFWQVVGEMYSKYFHSPLK